MTIIKGRGKGNLLEGMEEMNDIWDRYVHAAQAGDMYEDDYAFFEEWIYEVNAYNIVFEGMGKLFGESIMDDITQLQNEYVYLH